jgi:hypothetical protein
VLLLLLIDLTLDGARLHVKWRLYVGVVGLVDLRKCVVLNPRIGDSLQILNAVEESTVAKSVVGVTGSLFAVDVLPRSVQDVSR